MEHQTADQTIRFYVGTYTRGQSKGIYLFDLDLATGRLGAGRLAGEVANPSFLAFHPGRPLLYAASEIADFAGQKSGAISSFAVDPASGMLSLINQQPSGGAGPCHLTVDGTGRCVLAGNYRGGNAVVLPIREDGGLASASAVVQHSGSGPNPKRQEGPHAHSVHLDPAGRLAFVIDLGLDKVMIYRFDPSLGTLTPHDPPFAMIAAGGGPRHMAWHPSGRFAFVNQEMGNAVTVFAFDAARGALREVQTVPTLPAGFTGQSTTAEIAVHPTGRFVYCSNRGHDSIAIYGCDPGTGKLTVVGHSPSGGKNPRHFAIDPTGRWLVAAHQDSDNVVVLAIDPATGTLKKSAEASVPVPVCVKFATTPAGR